MADITSEYLTKICKCKLNLLYLQNFNQIETPLHWWY